MPTIHCVSRSFLVQLGVSAPPPPPTVDQIWVQLQRDPDYFRFLLTRDEGEKADGNDICPETLADPLVATGKSCKDEANGSTDTVDAADKLSTQDEYGKDLLNSPNSIITNVALALDKACREDGKCSNGLIRVNEKFQIADSSCGNVQFDVPPADKVESTQNSNTSSAANNIELGSATLQESMQKRNVSVLDEAFIRNESTEENSNVEKRECPKNIFGNESNAKRAANDSAAVAKENNMRKIETNFAEPSVYPRIETLGNSLAASDKAYKQVANGSTHTVGAADKSFTKDAKDLLNSPNSMSKNVALNESCRKDKKGSSNLILVDEKSQITDSSCGNVQFDVLLEEKVKKMQNGNTSSDGNTFELKSATLQESVQKRKAWVLDNAFDGTKPMETGKSGEKSKTPETVAGIEANANQAVDDSSTAAEEHNAGRKETNFTTPSISLRKSPRPNIPGVYPMSGRPGKWKVEIGYHGKRLCFGSTTWERAVLANQIARGKLDATRKSNLNADEIELSIMYEKETTLRVLDGFKDHARIGTADEQLISGNITKMSCQAWRALRLVEETCVTANQNAVCKSCASPSEIICNFVPKQLHSMPVVLCQLSSSGSWQVAIHYQCRQRCIGMFAEREHAMLVNNGARVMLKLMASGNFRARKRIRSPSRAALKRAKVKTGKSHFPMAIDFRNRGLTQVASGKWPFCIPNRTSGKQKETSQLQSSWCLFPPTLSGAHQSHIDRLVNIQKCAKIAQQSARMMNMQMRQFTAQQSYHGSHKPNHHQHPHNPQQAQQQRAHLAEQIFVGSFWFYVDLQGIIQGPYEPGQMRQWFESGYLDDDLPIGRAYNGPFYKLSSYFFKQTFAGSLWFYVDLQGIIQGPYEPGQMRQWFGSGYLNDDLKIGCAYNGPFFKLSSYVSGCN